MLLFAGNMTPGVKPTEGYGLSLGLSHVNERTEFIGSIFGSLVHDHCRNDGNRK